jgi:hypothetical protein
MKDKQSLHLKVQEQIDCFSTSDPLRGMSMLKDDTDKVEVALKWIALAALHGINNNAKKISITRSDDGNTRVIAAYRDTELPSPGPEVSEDIIKAVREITHIEDEKGKMQLALGVRDSSINLEVKIKAKKNRKQVTLKFPG